ncbi:MAG: hypothetical protein ACRELY_30345, partial [Polyangiaceae bacterium]
FQAVWYQAIWYNLPNDEWWTISRVPRHVNPPSVFVASLLACIAIGYFVELALRDTEHPKPHLRGAQLGLFYGAGIWLTNTFVLDQFDQRPLLFTFAVGFAVILGLAIAGFIVGMFHRKNLSASRA